jgi:hypothetical protein
MGYQTFEYHYMYKKRQYLLFAINYVGNRTRKWVRNYLQITTYQSWYVGMYGYNYKIR